MSEDKRTPQDKRIDRRGFIILIVVAACFITLAVVRVIVRNQEKNSETKAPTETSELVLYNFLETNMKTGNMNSTIPLMAKISPRSSGTSSPYNPNPSDVTSEGLLVSP